MPSAPKARPARRSNEILCRCKSHCTTLNPSTGVHEGEGHLLASYNYARHQRDDRLRALLQLEVAAHAPNLPSTTDETTWLQLIFQELQLISQLPVTTIGRPLAFRHDPESYTGAYRTEWPDDRSLAILRPNTGDHSLKPWEVVNLPYLKTESRLWELFQILSKFDQSEQAVAVQLKAYEGLQRLDREKEIQWNYQRSPLNSHYFNTDIFFRPVTPRDTTTLAACISALILHNISFASRRSVSVQLAGLSDILEAASVPHTLPRDPRCLATQFHLDPITSIYIVCPTCHCLYRYDPSPQQPKTLPTCTFKKTPTSTPCGESLWKVSKYGPFQEKIVPVKKYVHQDLKSWLGRLLSRPSIEDWLEKPPHPPSDRPDEVDDIWLGEVFASLKGKDGRVFYPGEGGELRLIFSLSVDGFDPFGMKAGKQSAASTGIWLALLNLPRHLRYQQENMYVAGVIPGPWKPASDQINHYVQLVVNDLKEFWDPGVTYSRTYSRLRGRRAKAMVVPLVCDLLGARQVIGYPGTLTAHYFCTACDLDIDDINNLDRSQWPPKDLEEIRRFASLFRDSDTDKKQKAIFEGCGWQ